MKNTKGKVIRVSSEVFDLLEKKKKAFRSWDALMRCLLGLPARKGKFPKLREFWVVRGSKKIFDRLSEAKGESIKLAVSEGQAPEPPAKVREVL